MKKKFTVDGKEYNSIKECCRAYNLNYLMVYNQMNYHNISLEDAIHKCLNGNILRKKFVYGGVEYKTFKDCCEHYKVSRGCIYHYIKKYGLSKEQALKEYLGKDRKLGYSFLFEGKEYHTFTECCRFYGFSYRTITKYAKYHNISIQEALADYCNGNTKTRTVYAFVFDGVTYKNFKECCLAYGLDYNKVRSYSSCHYKVPKEDVLRKFLAEQEK